MIIAKTFVFDSSHQLPDEECYGKCRNLHGHTYKLTVSVSGIVNHKGWIINFSDLKKIVNENVIDKLDHNHLNNIIPLPTAENILIWIEQEIIFKLEDIGVKLFSLKLWETPTSYAELICE